MVAVERGEVVALTRAYLHDNALSSYGQSAVLRCEICVQTSRSYEDVGEMCPEFVRRLLCGLLYGCRAIF